MECSGLDGLSPVALDHAGKPRNCGAMKGCSGHARITGPCGDTMEFWVRVSEGSVSQAKFVTDGCATSHACGSMATTLAVGQPVARIATITQQCILDELGGLPSDSRHCALLASNTLIAACADYTGRMRGANGDEGPPQARCTTCDDVMCTAHRAPGESDEEYARRRKIERRMVHVQRKIVVLSGKGGVGKSTVAVNLAAGLAKLGKRVALLDADIHGPSLPSMLGLEDATVERRNNELLPVRAGSIGVMSLGFFLQTHDEAIIWRGPMKFAAIAQLLGDTAWGELDYLVADLPPGTGDEPLSICQLLDKVDGAVVVTTPQHVAIVDVRKSVSFCKKLGVPVLGIVENMSGWACPDCGSVVHLFGRDGGRKMAKEMRVPFLGSIPIDPAIVESCDGGRPFMTDHEESPAGRAYLALASRVAGRDETPEGQDCSTIEEEKKTMKIAIPLAGGKLAMHFGHCDVFAILDVDTGNKSILSRKDIEPPPHQPGMLPPWLGSQGVNVIIAGGMGQRALGLFAEQGIQVLTGAPAEPAEVLVRDYLAGTIATGDNVCDH